MQWRIGLIVAALLIGACEGSGGGGSPTGPAELPEPVSVSRVELTPLSGATTVGGTVQFSATALDRNGNVFPGRAVTWEVMNPSVAAISRGGLAQGLAIGTSVIKASVEGVNAFALFDVGQQRKSEKPGKPDQPAQWTDDSSNNTADEAPGREPGPEKRRIRQETFERESHRLHVEQARQMRANSGKDGPHF